MQYFILHYGDLPKSWVDTKVVRKHVLNSKKKKKIRPKEIKHYCYSTNYIKEHCVEFCCKVHDLWILSPNQSSLSFIESAIQLAPWPFHLVSQGHLKLQLSSAELLTFPSGKCLWTSASYILRGVYKAFISVPGMQIHSLNVVEDDIDDDWWGGFLCTQLVEPEIKQFVFILLVTSCPAFTPFPGSVNSASKIHEESSLCSPTRLSSRAPSCFSWTQPHCDCPWPCPSPWGRPEWSS